MSEARFYISDDQVQERMDAERIIDPKGSLFTRQCIAASKMGRELFGLTGDVIVTVFPHLDGTGFYVAQAESDTG